MIVRSFKIFRVTKAGVESRSLNTHHVKKGVTSARAESTSVIELVHAFKHQTSVDDAQTKETYPLDVTVEGAFEAAENINKHGFTDG